MAESKHTEGPWHVEYSPNFRSRGNTHIVLNGDRYPAAMVPAWDAPEDGEEYAAEEALANARLIAAAPDLYEALKEARGWVVLAEDLCRDNSKALALIDSALSKASSLAESSSVTSSRPEEEE
ncbi:hypothetical protein [Bosea sp. Root381]|uniref:hypothetical protein n=1 Tax=Bosea sp. Root381 TaxID=1736524 RepID=UPI000AF9EFED|nr:hypothetical protein [Bosea sp. Root381]